MEPLILLAVGALAALCLVAGGRASLLRARRWPVRLPPPAVSRAEAEAIALGEWERRGFLAGRPGASARATAGPRSYTVRLDWGGIPIPWMEVDARTGAVTRFVAPPR